MTRRKAPPRRDGTGRAKEDRRAMRSKPLNAIDNARQPQAGVLACLDGFYRFAILAPAIIPPALLIRRSVAEPGQHVGVE